MLMQASSISQVLLFIEFNLVMQCPCGLFINHPFRSRCLEEEARGAGERRGDGGSNILGSVPGARRGQETGCNRARRMEGPKGLKMKSWADDGLEEDTHNPPLCRKQSQLKTCESKCFFLPPHPCSSPKQQNFPTSLKEMDLYSKGMKNPAPEHWPSDSLYMRQRTRGWGRWLIS